MNKFQFTLSLLSTVIVLFLFGPRIIFAEQEAEDNHHYIDLDGDGINDNAVDKDNDGIPDSFGSRSALIEESPINETKDFISLDFGQVTEINSALSKSGKFDQLRFSVRGLTLCRGELGSEKSFGPGAGIGAGVVNNACPGGVCIID